MSSGSIMENDNMSSNSNLTNSNMSFDSSPSLIGYLWYVYDMKGSAIMILRYGYTVKFLLFFLFDCTLRDYGGPHWVIYFVEFTDFWGLIL